MSILSLPLAPENARSGDEYYNTIEGRFYSFSDGEWSATATDATVTPMVETKVEEAIDENVKILKNTATGTNAITIGSANASTGQESVNIGYNSNSNGYRSIALGSEAKSTSTGGIAIGYGSQATQMNSEAIGGRATATASLIIGRGINSEANTFKVALVGSSASMATNESTGLYTLLKSDGKIPVERLGGSSSSTNEKYLKEDGSWQEIENETYEAGPGIDITDNMISVKSPVLQNTATGTNSLTVGGIASSNGTATNIGINSPAAGTNGTSLGYYSKGSGTASIAVGSISQATATQATAIGYKAQATANSAIVLGSGINNETKTFKVSLYNGDGAATTEEQGLYTLLKSDGTIPVERLGGSSSSTNNKFLKENGTWEEVQSGSTYTAGKNIQISDENIIEAKDTTYSAGKDISLTAVLNCTKVGNPTLYDGGGSGNYSDNDYFKTKDWFKNAKKSFELYIPIYPTSNPTGNNGIFDGGASDAGGHYGLRLTYNSNKTIRLRISTDGSATFPVDISGTAVFNLNLWHYIKVTYNSTEGYKLYTKINGSSDWTLEGSSSVTDKPFTDSEIEYRIGDNTATGASFVGSISLTGLYILVDGNEVFRPALNTKINYNGFTNTATGTNSLTLGGSVAEQSHATNIGISSSVKEYAVAIGYGSDANEDYAVAIGYSSHTLSGGTKSVAIGNNSSCYSFGVAIGNNTTSSGNQCTTVGHSAQSTAERSVAIGAWTEATGIRSTSLGYSSKANANYALSLGNQSIASEIGAIQIGSGTNNIAGTLAVGLSTDGTNWNNYTLLKSTGKIPVERLENVNLLSTGINPAITTVAKYNSQIMLNNAVGSKNDLWYCNTITQNSINGTVTGKLLRNGNYVSGFGVTSYINTNITLASTDTYELLLKLRVDDFINGSSNQAFLTDASNPYLFMFNSAKKMTGYNNGTYFNGTYVYDNNWHWLKIKWDGTNLTASYLKDGSQTYKIDTLPTEGWTTDITGTTNIFSGKTLCLGNRPNNLQPYAGSFDLNGCQFIKNGSVVWSGIVNNGTTEYYWRSPLYSTNNPTSVQIGGLVQGTNDIVIGSNSRTTSDNSVVIGNDAWSGSTGSTVNNVVIGCSAKLNAGYSVAIGNNASGSTGTISIGYSSVANQQDAIAIGVASQATAKGAIALGANARNSETKTFKVALNDSNIAAVDESTGLFTLLNSDGKIPVERLGGSSESTNNKYLRENGTWEEVQSGSSYTAGNGIDISSDNVISNTGLINTATGENSLTIGGTPATINSGTNIGFNSEAGANAATALGQQTHAKGILSTAIGVNASAYGWGSIQIGQGTNTDANSLQIYNYKLLDGDGFIPNERLNFIINKNAIDKNFIDQGNKGLYNVTLKSGATLENGIVSGGSGAKCNNTESLSFTSSFEIVAKGVITALSGWQQFFNCPNSVRSLDLGIWNGKVYFNGPNVGSDVQGDTAFNIDDIVWVKLTYSNGLYQAYYSTNGTDYTLTASKSVTPLSSMSFNELNIACLSNAKTYVEGSYCKLDDVEVWRGTYAISTDNVAKASTTAYGLVKPDGTTITINDGVISATGGSSVIDDTSTALYKTWSANKLNTIIGDLETLINEL